METPAERVAWPVPGVTRVARDRERYEASRCLAMATPGR
jgi:hypothetical protein